MTIFGCVIWIGMPFFTQQNLPAADKLYVMAEPPIIAPIPPALPGVANVVAPVAAAIAPTGATAATPSAPLATDDRFVTGSGVLDLGSIKHTTGHFTSPSTLRAEIIHEASIDPQSPILVVFDVHGTLLEPTWRDEYKELYQKLTGHAASDEWIDANLLHKSDEHIVSIFMALSGLSKDEVAELIRNNRRELRDRDTPILKPGAVALLKALKENNIPVIAISGSRRERLLQQLGERGLLDFIPADHVIGRTSDERSAAERDQIIESIYLQFRGYSILYFDDWTDGHGRIMEFGGVCIGLPQGTGAEYDDNRHALIDAGVGCILPRLPTWMEFARLFHLEDFKQPDPPKIPVATDSARRLRAILPAERPNPLGLFVRVSWDLSTLTYFGIQDDSMVFRADGRTDLGAIKLFPLFSIPSNNLITPDRYIAHHLPPEMRAQLTRLLERKKHYTEYGGVIVSWDEEIDRDTWTTSIDTLFIIKVLKELGVIDDASIKRVTEAGVGGGHISAFMAAGMPSIEQLTITDISMHALRTAVRSITPHLKPRTRIVTYWGKGLRTIDEDADLVIINPPYIPVPPDAASRDGDPYRGTGLIREIIQEGAARFPSARIFVNISSLANKDLRQYLTEAGAKIASPEGEIDIRVQQEFIATGGRRATIRPVGASMEVPLKIRGVNPAWIEWLIREGVLGQVLNPEPDVEPYRHNLQIYEIKSA